MFVLACAQKAGNDKLEQTHIEGLQYRGEQTKKPHLSCPDGYPNRARSSAGEHLVDIEGVTGSIPVVPTMITLCESRGFSCLGASHVGVYRDYRLQFRL